MTSHPDWQAAAQSALRLLLILALAAGLLAAIAGIWRGWPAVEGVVFALLVVSISVLAVAFAAASTPDRTKSAFRVLGVGMISRMGLGLGSAWAVHRFRPDCFESGFLVWLIVLYLAGLGLETWQQQQRMAPSE